MRRTQAQLWTQACLSRALLKMQRKAGSHPTRPHPSPYPGTFPSSPSYPPIAANGMQLYLTQTPPHPAIIQPQLLALPLRLPRLELRPPTHSLKKAWGVPVTTEPLASVLSAAMIARASSWPLSSSFSAFTTARVRGCSPTRLRTQAHRALATRISLAESRHTDL
jgi:hypothetical protein